MEKSEKEVMIKELNEKFARAKTAIVAEFSKLNVETVTRLRKKFRDSGVDYKVLKNTLAKRAAKGTPVEVVSDDFTGPVAIAIGYDDVVVPAKILQEFIKDLETIKIRSAVVEGKKVDCRRRGCTGEAAGAAGAPGEDPRDAQPAGGQARPDGGRARKPPRAPDQGPRRGTGEANIIAAIRFLTLSLGTALLRRVKSR